MLQSISSFLKVHKRKVLFLTVASAVGYASYRAYVALNDEIEAMKKRLKEQGAAGEQDAEARLEQVFVQAQMASDGAIMAFLAKVEHRLNQLVPRITAAELKEQVAQCKSPEEKLALVQATSRSVLLHTGVCLYAIAVLAVSFKATYAVAAAAMVESESDVASVAAAAEELASRISDRLVSSEDGLSKMVLHVQNALDQCLAHWTVRQPCSFSAFTDLWRNVRYQAEDISMDASIMVAPGEAVRRSLIHHAFPFAANGAASEKPLFARVDATLSNNSTLDVLADVLERLFATYFAQIAPKFDPGNVLPLLRVSPLLQSESAVILSGGENNIYLENGFLRNETLLSYLHDAVGIRQNDVARRILFVCDRNQRESVLASAFARLHGARSGLFMLDVFSAAATNQVEASTADEDVIECLELLGVGNARSHKPAGLLSIPCDVTFDAVVVMGKTVPERAIAAKQTLNWTHEVSHPTLFETKEAIDKKVRQLLGSL